MSEVLHNFYCAYKAWLDAGAPNNNPFSRSRGLCHAIKIFVLRQELQSAYSYLYSARAEMCSQFKAASLDPDYPFNTPDYIADDVHNYYMEAAREEIHLNPARVAWVHTMSAGGDNNE